MDFRQNEFLSVQKSKVSFIKELIKDSLSLFVNIIPLSFFPKKVYFLYSHHVYQDELNSFKKLIDRLEKDFKIVSYSKAIELLKEKKLKNRYLCISFDDGFENNLVAADFLKSKEISAMFFVNSQAVANYNNKEFVQQHCENKLNCKPIPFMNWDDLKKLLKDGHEIGNHGYSHTKLTLLNSSKEVIEEIDKGKEDLKNNLGLNDVHFAWCYGTMNDVTEEAINYGNKTHLSIASAIRGFTDSNFSFIKRDQILFSESYRRLLFYFKLNHLLFWK